MKYRFAVVIFSVSIFSMVYATSLTADYGRHLAKVVDDTVKTIHATESRSFITHADILALMCVEQRSLRIGNNSPVGARGLTQVMPNTFRDYYNRNKHGFRDFVNRTNCSIKALSQDPRCSIEAGARIFDDLLVRYNGDRNKAAGAYHGGPGAVISKTQYRGPKTTKYANEWFPSCFNKIVNNKTPESNEVWRALVSGVSDLTGGTFGTQGVSATLVQYKAGSDTYMYDSVMSSPTATNPMFGSLISASYNPDTPGVIPVQVSNTDITTTRSSQEDYFVLSALYSGDTTQDADEGYVHKETEKDRSDKKNKSKTTKDKSANIINNDTYNTGSDINYTTDYGQPREAEQLSFFGKLWSNFWGWADRESNNEVTQKQNMPGVGTNNMQENSNSIQSADEFFGTSQSNRQEKSRGVNNLNFGSNFDTNDGFLHCLPNQVLSGEPFLLAYACPKNYTFSSSDFGADSDLGVKTYSLMENKTLQYSCSSESKTINYKCSVAIVNPQILSFTAVDKEGSILQVKWETKDIESCKLLTEAMKILREGVSGSVFIDTSTLQSSSLQLICNSKSGTQVKETINI